MGMNTTHASTNLAQPITPGAAARYWRATRARDPRADGTFFLIYNHTRMRRFPLNVARSTDDGKSWQMVATLRTRPANFLILRSSKRATAGST